MKLSIILPVIVFAALGWVFGYQQAYKDLVPQLSQTARMGLAEHENLKKAYATIQGLAADFYTCKQNEDLLRVNFNLFMKGERFTYYPLPGEKLKSVR